ncbi:MAG: porin, partial [Candidatus Kuenenia stuttgartiensis]|nr:porin [Candidatus Kuenenia stuttgartiensis]
MIGRKWRNFMLPNFFVFCVLCMGGVSPIVFAQGESSTDARSEVEELKQQLKLMEEAFARQQEQMDVLKNRIEIISTETKVVVKEETKQAVQDYFSTDEAKEILGVGMPDMIVEYTPDDKKSALSIRTTDGNYSLNIGGRLQMQYEYKDKDDDFGESDTQNIDVRRARLNFGGNIYSKDLHYYVEIDGDKFDVGVRDFYVYWTPLEELNTKIGYFKVPFNRQRLASSATLLLQERSIASEFFDQDRDYGVDLYGKPFDGYMEYHAAVFQGAGEDQADWFQGKENFDNEL